MHILCVTNIVLTGIGGFNVRLRSTRNKDKDEEGGGEVVSGAVTPTSSGPTNPNNLEGGSAAEDKPRRKAQRRRLKNRLMECYPLYLQVSKYTSDMRFEVLTVVMQKIWVIWHLMPCHLASRFQHFEGQCCLLVQHQAVQEE
jgi:hypothetical protein